MDLSPTQERIVTLLRQYAGQDVAIPRIYEAAYRVKVCTELEDGRVMHSLSVRYMQQRIGPFISKANKRLVGERIVPGELKKTYRLVSRDAD
jgi:hypothetical protein